MPKLKNVNKLTVQNEFHDARDHRKDDHILAAKEKFNRINNLIPNVKGKVVGRPRKTLALRISQPRFETRKPGRSWQ